MTFTAALTDRLTFPQDLPTHIQHYINGEFVDSVGGKTFDVLDPVSNSCYRTPPPARRKTSTSPSPPPATRSPTARGRR